MNPTLRSSPAHAFVASLEVPELDDTDDHHLRRVLRLTAGEPFTVSDGHGGWRQVALSPTGVDVVGPVHQVPQPAAAAVFAAIPKGDRPELIVQKVTELGISTFGFVSTARSVVRWDGDRAAKQLGRLQRVAREAAMQSRRTWLPTIVGVQPLADVAAMPGAVAAEPFGDGSAAAWQAVTAVVVGPEGGFTADELGWFARTVCLGSTVLRVETAAIAAAVRLQLAANPS